MSKTTLYIFLALTCAALYTLTHFTINSSPSEPTGLYRPTHEPLKRGALVLLKMPLKTIAALPGDQVDMTPTGIEINGKPLPAREPNQFDRRTGLDQVTK
jgi:type IV secretory pathway protease TraF